MPGLVLDGEWRFADPAESGRYYSAPYWRIARALFRITPERRVGRGLTYRFGSTRGGRV